MKACNLSEVMLINSDFSQANMEGAIMKGLRGEVSRFIGANMIRVDLSGAKLHGACFDEANLHHADLRQSQFTDASFIKANAEKIKLEGSHLPWADFSYTNLVSADFRKVNLDGAKTHCMDDRDTLWEGASRIDERVTDRDLATAEKWQPPRVK
jgi:uncharacterized protein YjbI with pentapeptide repeats